MKIRYRISLWFIGGGLLSTLLLSLFVVYEKATLPYELIDDELLSQVNSIADLLRENRSDAEVASVLKSLSRPYWIQLFDHKNEVIFSSDLVALVDIPLKQAPSFYNVNTQAHWVSSSRGRIVKKKPNSGYTSLSLMMAVRPLCSTSLGRWRI